MTLREEFEKEVNSVNNISVDKLFRASNSEYIKWLENKYNDYECDECELDSFGIDDIADYLEEEDYNFSKHIGEENCIEFLEDSGYTVLTNSEADNGLDIIDSRMLEEIEDIFINSSVFEREKIYNLITTWI